MFNSFYFKNFVFIFTVTTTPFNLHIQELVSIYYFYFSDRVNETDEDQVTVRYMEGYMQVEYPLRVQFLQVIDLGS